MVNKLIFLSRTMEFKGSIREITLDEIHNFKL